MLIMPHDDYLKRVAVMGLTSGIPHVEITDEAKNDKAIYLYELAYDREGTVWHLTFHGRSYYGEFLKSIRDVYATVLWYGHRIYFKTSTEFSDFLCNRFKLILLELNDRCPICGGPMNGQLRYMYSDGSGLPYDLHFCGLSCLQYFTRHYDVYKDMYKHCLNKTDTHDYYPIWEGGLNKDYDDPTNTTELMDLSAIPEEEPDPLNACGCRIKGDSNPEQILPEEPDYVQQQKERRLEDKRLREEEYKRIAEEQKRIDEERLYQEYLKIQEVEQARLAEERKRLEEERKRLAEERRRQEEEERRRKEIEDRKRREEEMLKRLEEEERRRKEEAERKRREEEERKRQEEEERKRLEEEAKKPVNYSTVRNANELSYKYGYNEIKDNPQYKDLYIKICNALYYNGYRNGVAFSEYVTDDTVVATPTLYTDTDASGGELTYLLVNVGTTQFSYAELYYVYRCVYFDFPEYMGVCSSIATAYDKEHEYNLIAIRHYPETKRQQYLQEIHTGFEAICQVIERKLGLKYQADKSFAEKNKLYTAKQQRAIAKIIYDYIILNCEYGIATSTADDCINQTMYPALCGKYTEQGDLYGPVCASYAMSYAYCCQQWGIHCINIVGGCGNARDGRHQWNMVAFVQGAVVPQHITSNKWQEVDLTWGDGGKNLITWAYLNVPTRNLNAAQPNFSYDGICYTVGDVRSKFPTVDSLELINMENFGTLPDNSQRYVVESYKYYPSGTCTDNQYKYSYNTYKIDGIMHTSDIGDNGIYDTSDSNFGYYYWR